MMELRWLRITLFCVSFAGTIAAKGGASILPAHHCDADNDCVLFYVKCDPLTAIARNSLPATATISESSKSEMFVANANAKGSCLRNYFVAHPYFVNPVAKCIKKKCEIVSGEPKSENEMILEDPE